MTEFSVNTEFENLIKAMLIEQWQQQQTEEMTTVPEKKNKLEKSLDFFQNNNAIKKKFFSKPYTTTRIKSRNFLSNISYVCINKEDFYKKIFLFDNYTLLNKNLNLFLLDRKLNDHNKHEMIYMLWKECMSSDFYRYIFTEENFCILMEKTCCIQKWLKLFGNLFRSMKKTVTSNVITFVNLRTYFSMSIQMCTLRCIVQLNGEVLIREVHFTFFLKLIRTKKSLNNPSKIAKIPLLKEMNRLLLYRS